MKENMLIFRLILAQTKIGSSRNSNHLAKHLLCQLKYRTAFSMRKFVKTSVGVGGIVDLVYGQAELCMGRCMGGVWVHDW